ncbi:hypothetical protein AAHZ94_04075 [Streptomyces sp. HSW2009]|uniref:hypothetical protein n=1 Tax=Streptomyces sp. HSW2009 TaxID=3142890 RepID=UPI0032EEF10A
MQLLWEGEFCPRMLSTPDEILLFTGCAPHASVLTYPEETQAAEETEAVEETEVAEEAMNP